jgi:ABC-type branched-subunit amino acid transport system substrate-binding protein
MSRLRRWARAGLRLALVSAALAVPAAAGSYRIGVAVPLSGPRRPRGEMLLRALRLKADELNAAGGVGGRGIELLVRDDRGTAEGARKAAAELAGDPLVLAVIGHYDSEPAAAAVPVYSSDHVPVFLPSVGDSGVLAHSRWVFSGTCSGRDEAQTMAVFIKAVRLHSRVLVLHTGDQYGRDMWDAFAKKAERIGLRTRGLEVPAKNVPADLAAHRLLPVLPGIDAVVVLGHSATGGVVIRQLREHGCRLPVWGSSRIVSGDLMATLGGHAEDLHVALPFMFDVGSLKAVEFRRKYLERYASEPHPFGLFAYDGLGLVAEAIRTKGPDRAAIRDYLAGLDSPANAYDGASGRLFFNRDGSMARDTIMATAFGDGFCPTFQQLRLVTDRHSLDNLAGKVKRGEIIVADQVPYFLVSVVYAGIEWYRVDQVSVKDLSFDAEFFVWLNWSGEFDADNVQFLNEVAGKVQRVELRRVTAPPAFRGGPRIHWVSYRYKGTFLHPYDLHRFPFDRQELHLRLSHKDLDADRVLFVADRINIVGRPISDIYPHEWRDVGREDYGATFRYASAFGDPTYRPGEAQAPYSVYQTTLRIQRLLFPYLVTLFLPLGILIFVSFLVLLIPKEQFSTRNSLVMSSLLGVLVYHMAQARSLPQVGYLMTSDLYFVSAYMLLAFLILGVNVVNILHSRKQEERAARLDLWLRRGFIAGTLAAYAALTLSAMQAPR